MTIAYGSYRNWQLAVSGTVRRLLPWDSAAPSLTRLAQHASGAVYKLLKIFPPSDLKLIVDFAKRL